MSASEKNDRRQIPEPATTGDLAASPPADKEPRIDRANHSLSRFATRRFLEAYPGRCSYPVEAARRANASVEQILYLAGNAGFDVAAARQAGFSNEQIIDYLARGDETPSDDSELAGKSGASAETSDELVTAGQEAASAEELNHNLTETARALSRTPETTSPTESAAVSENVPTSGVMPEARLRDLNNDCPSPSPLRAAEQLKDEPEKPDPQAEGGVILADLVEFIRRFVVISDAQATVLALWTVHTHCFAACDATAYIWLSSAEKRSGKTRVEEVEELVVAKPWYTGRVTPACLVRKIDAQQPTLLLDESDTALASSEEYREALTGVLNMGHRRGGKTSCCVGRGADITFKDFDAFSPKMIAGLRSIPDTVRDRAIPIRIQRKTKDTKIERFRRGRVEPEASKLRARIAAWSKTQMASLRKANPDLPAKLTDRMQDGAEPLLAIAELVGHGWPEKARQALVELCCTGSAAEDDSVGVLLLTDIARIFAEAGDGKTLKLASDYIVKQLGEMEERPWSEWGRQKKPITKTGLASQLGKDKYEIYPRLLNLGGDDRARGYFRRHFVDAWRRYCTNVNAELIQAANSDPDPDDEKPVQDTLFADAAETGNRSANPSVTQPLRVSPNVHAGSNTVTVQKGGTSTSDRKKVEL